MCCFVSQNSSWFCMAFCMAGTTEKRCRRLTGQSLFWMWKPCNDGMGVPFTMSSGGSACCDVDLCLSSLEEKEWMLTADKHLRIVVYELNWLKVRGSVQARPSHFSRFFGKSSCRFCVFLELQHNQSWCCKQSAKLPLSAFMIICDLLIMFVPRPLLFPCTVETSVPKATTIDFRPVSDSSGRHGGGSEAVFVRDSMVANTETFDGRGGVTYSSI